MDEQQRTAIIRETFNTVSGSYDGGALRFFPESAKHLAALPGLKGGEQVLDVATGTGHAARALAARLPRGRVTAVDFSPGMLDRARTKAASLQVRNVDFPERDMQHLGFARSPFDAAVCAFGIFFADDRDATLAHIAGTVTPGGRIAVSGFQEDYFHPFKELLFARLAGRGIQLPPPAWKRIATEQGCKELLRNAGLLDVRVEQRNVGYFLGGADEWWDVVRNAGFRRMVGQLAPQDQDLFRREHLREVAALATRDGIWLDVGILLAVGTQR